MPPVHQQGTPNVVVIGGEVMAEFVHVSIKIPPVWLLMYLVLCAEKAEA